ncbi:hypothetical protein [Tengunoibacter tsumagoiensis]|uniref:LppX_LprAFG lipoprotein n=1 Tax=Tengunoibacter tsumagoiensis TaxID=2014871 RepID=A0A401ZVA4_9CHLR|nr:hypothetical protein [Tengunoibacter tsumagoiensis]GCE10670.1 hypothetical protein KTT_05290 [Tengunoibacter tsumagoiensis]
MKIREKSTLLFGALTIGLVLLLSACDQTVTGNTASNLTPLQVLQKSADAMSNLQSSHVDVTGTDSVHIGGLSLTPTPTQAQGTPTVAQGGDITVQLTGKGDQAGADKQQMDVTATTLNQPTNLSEIVLGDKVYVKNPQGKWYVLNKSDYQGMFANATNPFSGINIDQKTLLGVIQHVKINDHGADKLNGVSLRHITASLDKTALKELLTKDPQIVSTIGQQNINTLLDSTKALDSSVDVWIDENQFYVHRTELKINLTADTDTTQQGGGKLTVVTKFDNIIDLSNFNKPVTIVAPADATPTTNPSDIFGGAIAAQ